MHLDGVRRPANPGPHPFQNLGKSRIALQAGPAHALHAHLSARDGCPGKKIGGRRGISFNQDFARGTVTLTGGYAELPIRRRVDGHAEAFHQGDRHVHIRAGDEPVRDLHGDRIARQGRRQQYRRHELAAGFAADDHTPPPKAVGVQAQGRISLVSQVFDACTELP